MSINRFGAAVLAALMVALPAYANDGGGGKGDAAQRTLQQQEQQEEEQVLEAVPSDPASVAARDFYTSVVAGLDSAIREMRERIAAREKAIASIDLKVVKDFAADRADDKTTEDMRKSAQTAWSQLVNDRNFKLAEKGLPIDPSVPQAVTQFAQFNSEVSALERLEAARADMAAAGKAYGATIN